MFENGQIAVFQGILPKFRESLKSHCIVLGIIDYFGRKRCQKKRNDLSYHLLQDLRSAVKNSFSIYEWRKVDSCFCEALYPPSFKQPRDLLLLILCFSHASRWMKIKATIHKRLFEKIH